MNERNETPETAQAVLRGGTPPSEENRARLLDFLSKKYQTAFTLRFVRDDSLAGGFVLQAQGDTYDWSVEGRMRQFKERLDRVPSDREDVIPLIRETVENWTPQVLPEEIGQVLTVGDEIATVSGLEHAAYGEILTFSSGVKGMVQDLRPDGCGIIIRLHLLLELVDGLAHGGTLGGVHRPQILHQSGHLPVFAQVFLPERGQRLLGGDLRKVRFGLFCQLFNDCLHTFSLLFQQYLAASGRNRKEAPSPGGHWPAKGRILSKRLRGTTQRPRRCDAARHSNAVTGLTVPHYRAAARCLSRGPLRSELRHCCLREPFQPVELLSAPGAQHVLSPSSRFFVIRFAYSSTKRRVLQAFRPGPVTGSGGWGRGTGTCIP